MCKSKFKSICAAFREIGFTRAAPPRKTRQRVVLASTTGQTLERNQIDGERRTPTASTAIRTPFGSGSVRRSTDRATISTNEKGFELFDWAYATYLGEQPFIDKKMQIKIDEPVVDQSLCAGMPFDHSRLTSPLWLTLQALVTIGTIDEDHTFAVLDGMVNGVHVVATVTGVVLHIHSESLYSQMNLLLSAHNIQLHDNVVVVIHNRLPTSSENSDER